MTDEIMHVSVGDLKPGRFLLIDGVPCKVVDIETSAPGKHGSAKVRITAIGMFDGSKKTLLKPSHSDVEAPVISKRKAQVVSISGDNAQLMDLETYDTYDLVIPEDLRGSVKAGSEIEVIEAMGKKAMTRVTAGGN
ncbi:MAG: translation initiation factor IF-5A [Candidatus Micrarchaeota archaeon]|nr:translation initiation factor IF-5A [Candidatus Micrarchaeota archaeon]